MENEEMIGKRCVRGGTLLKFWERSVETHLVGLVRVLEGEQDAVGDPYIAWKQ